MARLSKICILSCLCSMIIITVMVIIPETPTSIEVPAPTPSSLCRTANSKAQSRGDSHHDCVCPSQHICVVATKAPVPCGLGQVADGYHIMDKAPAQCIDCSCLNIVDYASYLQNEDSAQPKEQDRSMSALAAMSVSDFPARIIFASIPRNGNSWMRQLVEAATGVATESVHHERYRVPVSIDASEKITVTTELSLRTWTYGSDCGRGNFCDSVHRARQGEPLIVKTHAPFLVKRSTAAAHDGSDAGIGAFLLLPIRNPLDNWQALCRYQNRTGGGGPPLTLAQFLEKWTHHHDYWQRHAQLHQVPAFSYRFEDMDQHRERILDIFLHQSGLWGRYRLNRDSVNRAMEIKRLRPLTTTSHASLAYFSNAYTQYTPEQIRQVLAYTPARQWLQLYGYHTLYETWLWAHDEAHKAQSNVSAIRAIAQRRIEQSFAAVQDMLYGT
eukprot:TRINITY_DN7356_c0_g1_i3.p1 TRINITY_DN7356_c0_g1~~TRINITY_DN7356_c0_g1_i3.p1  ORF type:complete len:442 (+),score=26.84 TRINITY_DN7356_c0_g1_i3:74-1399(+)